MRHKKTGSFFARMGEAFFKWQVNREIFDRMFPHLEGEEDFGYPFETDVQMNAQTEELDVQPLLDSIEEHIRNMPKAYGECFRHILHRDLNEIIHRYEREARRRVNPRECDPRFVATRYEPEAVHQP